MIRLTNPSTEAMKESTTSNDAKIQQRRYLLPVYVYHAYYQSTQ